MSSGKSIQIFHILYQNTPISTFKKRYPCYKWDFYKMMPDCDLLPTTVLQGTVQGDKHDKSMNKYMYKVADLIAPGGHDCRKSPQYTVCMRNNVRCWRNVDVCAYYVTFDNNLA